MSLKDKISSTTGIAKQLTSPNNFFKRNLSENIPISTCMVRHIVKNMPTKESKRSKCREWGVVYKNRHKATISGTVTDSASSEPLSGVNVSIVESGEVVQTDDEGKYILHTDYNGEGTLEFSLAG